MNCELRTTIDAAAAAAWPSWPGRRAVPDAASPRRWAKRERRSCAPGAAACPATRSPTTTDPRPSRRPPSSSPTRRRRHRHARRPPRCRRRCAVLADRIRDDHGAIDILVNDIWGAEVLKGGPPLWNRPIWEHDLDDGLRILRLGIDTHLITSHCLLPLLVCKPGRSSRRGDRRDDRVQRRALPDLGVLRPGQGGGEPARLQPGPRTRRASARPRSPSRRAGCARR